jgi:serine/threonine-protein kinase RIO1
MQAAQFLGSVWLIRPVRWALIIALIVYKRWRHLAAALIVIALVELIAMGVTIAVARPRPLVLILGEWFGYSHPSIPVARLSVTLALIGLCLIPIGRWRTRWFVVGGLAVAALGIANIYLGVDHPTDSFTAAMLGVSVAVVFFRLWVPEEVFPVTYQRGRTAHLTIDERREAAIRRGLGDQLGIDAIAIEPFGLAGSGGSTPLRVKIAEDPDRYVFAKLYSRTHLRSDRWYKLGRTILYGSLEDEVRFSSVRRLVEYEDYVLLLMKNSGLPSPEPYGIVEITPEREYLMVFEFLDGAQELGDVAVTEEIIDDALLVVRRMWDAGIAHRDIKPANVMVRNGRVVLIDVAFATVRPSPWRQAVDLANMMVILALRSDPRLVYERALQYFSPDDIAEAFAATRSITIPAQSRSSLQLVKQDEGLDIIEEFRAMAPPRDPISVQRWSTRRIAVTAGVAVIGLGVVAFLIENVTGGGFI